MNVSGRSCAMKRRGRKKSARKKRKKKRKGTRKESGARSAEQRGERKEKKKYAAQSTVDLGDIWKWVFVLLVIGQSLVGANAASNEAQRKSGQVDGSNVGRNRSLSKQLGKTIPKRLRQECCEDRTGMQKESKMVVEEVRRVD